MKTLTVQQVAVLKGVSIQSVRDAIKAGKFPGIIREGEPIARSILKIPESEALDWQPRKYPRQSAP